MTSKRILALSITSAMVLAACQQPAPAPTVTAPSGVSVSASPSTIAPGGSSVLTVLIGNTGGAAITSVTNSLGTSCTLTTGTTYTCTVSPTATGPVTVTVTNSAGSTPASTNITVTGTTGPGTGPTLPGAPSVTLTQNSNTSVTVVATAGGTTTIKSAVVTVSKQGGSPVDFPIASAVGQTSINQPVDITAAVATAGTYVVSVRVVNSNDLPATASLTNSIVITAPVDTNPGGGPEAPGAAPVEDINLDTQFRFVTFDQVNTGGGVIPRITYVRGTFPITAAFTKLPSGAGVEYFLSNTVNETSNKIAGNVSSNGLSQGQRYRIVARSASGALLGEFLFVPDNRGPQTPDIVPATALSNALTSAYGNWVRGQIDGFQLKLENTRGLADNPQIPGVPAQNPGDNVERPAVGIKEIRYYAVSVPRNFSGDPGAVLPNGVASLTADQLITTVSANNIGGDSGSNNYSTRVATNATPAAAATGLKKLADGKYVVFAVAVDYLFNKSKVDFQSSFVLGVDTVGPQGNIFVKDRGPLDVHAQGPNCQRVDIYTADSAINGRINAPSDVFTALPGFVSGCALVNANATDFGIGFDNLNITGNIPGTIGGVSGVVSDPLNLTVDSNTNASLATDVVNLNNVTGSQTFIAPIADLLGNVGTLTSTPVIVDNEAPVNVAVSVASQNGSNRYSPWQQVGLQGTARDDISGFRTNNSNSEPGAGGFTFYYGTDPRSNPNGLYNNALVQIDASKVETLRSDQVTSAVTNFNLPLPNLAVNNDQRQAEGNLNLWALAADKAGNANAGFDRVIVDDDTDLSDLYTVPNITEDVGITEIGNGLNPYRGFTAANRSSAGIVPNLTRDELNPNAGPTPIQRELSDPLLQYGTLPLLGSRGTNNYELFVPTADIDFAGNPVRNLGIGRTTFAYRLPDPVANETNGNLVQQINPATYYGAVPYVYRALPANGSGPFYRNTAFSGVPFATKALCETATKVLCLLQVSGTPAYPNGAGLNENDFTADPADPRGVVSTTEFYPVIVSNPGTREELIERKGRFLYNLPAWSGGNANAGTADQIVLEPNQYIGYIWNTIGQDVERSPFRAVFDAALVNLNDRDISGNPLNPNYQSDFVIDGAARTDLSFPGGTYTIYKRGAIGVLAYNNFGAVDIQTKGVTSLNTEAIR